MKYQRDLRPQRAIGQSRPRRGGIFDLAKSMARPVAMGWLSLARAVATLLNVAIRAHRNGQLQGAPVDVARIASHVLRQHAGRIANERAVARHAIRASIRPMLGIGLPASRIHAAAHCANAAHGSVLTESEVAEIVALTAWEVANPEAD